MLEKYVISQAKICIYFTSSIVKAFLLKELVITVVLNDINLFEYSNKRNGFLFYKYIYSNYATGNVKFYLFLY